jgi:hypothetical protein
MDDSELNLYDVQAELSSGVAITSKNAFGYFLRLESRVPLMHRRMQDEIDELLYILLTV